MPTIARHLRSQHEQRFDTAADTTPPVLNVRWPDDNAMIAGDTFTLRGHLDDETAIVTAAIVGPSGTTNFIAGNIERNGSLWVENLPLTSGTNTVTLTATDAAGNTSTATLRVTKSALQLVMNPVPESQLNDSTVTVTGIINAVNYKVWVNGVAATLGGNTWTATGVPT